MHRLKAGLVGLLCLVGVAGCTTNNSIAPTVFSTNATLQLSVGTVQDYGNPAILASRITHTSVTGPTAFVNAVSTFRNQFGNSAYLVPGSASLTFPDLSVHTIGSLFEYGQAVGNNGIYGIPPAFNPIGTCVVTPDVCVPTGYLYESSPVRLTLGPIPVGGGTYTLATNVSVNGGTIPYSASATLPALAAVLPNPCTNLTFVSDTTGGGTFTLTPASPPAGVTERVVIVTFGTSSTTTVRAVVVASGSTAVVPDLTAAWASASPPANQTMAAGTRHAFCIGADFPWIESGQPNNTASAPNLTNGVNGTSNFSVSAYFNAVE